MVGSKSFRLGNTTKNRLVLISRVFETAYGPVGANYRFLCETPITNLN